MRSSPPGSRWRHPAEQNMLIDQMTQASFGLQRAVLRRAGQASERGTDHARAPAEDRLLAVAAGRLLTGDLRC
jgi:hypothetical protein